MANYDYDNNMNEGDDDSDCLWEEDVEEDVEDDRPRFYYEDDDDPMDGDFDSAMASAGHGMDEDYGG